MQLFIGFDVGGTHIKHGVIDENGNELTSDEFDTPDDKNAFKQQWKAVVEAYQKAHDIAAIGVSFLVISTPTRARRQRPAHSIISITRISANCSPN